eukprot:TRINITY_DN4828_c0_g1_i2.p2 TRINITY_DN4828_c0_g1~~TRINITY_DN4828_c0_g1_i2.p2  ORF type:complete len:318 (+),score=118.97 TRINITY_DN4828_c0_g1_i2:72-1025(+)
MAGGSFRRLGLGAAGLGTWAAFGACVEYYTEGDWLGRKQRHLAKDVAALREELDKVRAAREKDLARLREEVDVGEDALARGQQRLWQERVRRWRNTKEHDELIEVIPWIYWQWQRLGKWYQSMEDKLAGLNQRGYGDYQLIGLTTNDMMMAHNMAAYPTDLKLQALPDSLTLVRKVAEADPLLLCLEGAVAPCNFPTAPQVATGVEEIAMQLPELSPHLAAAAETLAAQPPLSEASAGALMGAVIAVRQQVMHVGNTEGLAWPEADNAKADAVFDNLNALGRALEDYQIGVQCQNVYEAHLTTLQLSLLGQAPKADA